VVWTESTLAAELEKRGWRLVHFELGGEIAGSSYAGKPTEAKPWFRGARHSNEAPAFADTPERLLERIDLYEDEHASRGLTSTSTVPVQQSGGPELPEPPPAPVEPELISASSPRRRPAAKKKRIVAGAGEDA
jgi:hypothetical protein